LKGSLHNHSNWSDGHGTLEEIAAYMQELGCDYWAITDHSKSPSRPTASNPRLRQQIKEVRALNQPKVRGGRRRFPIIDRFGGGHFVQGRLDFDDDLLAELDVVVASVHQGFTQSEAEMTKRVIAPRRIRFVHMLGHLTAAFCWSARLTKSTRPPSSTPAPPTGTWIELNANPLRFDMDWRLWHYAKDKGVKCVINCDAHRNEHAASCASAPASRAKAGWKRRRHQHAPAGQAAQGTRSIPNKTSRTGAVARCRCPG
jgi:DNA polymerase (family X)